MTQIHPPPICYIHCNCITNNNNYISSSINFLIYCSVGEKFKAVVKKIYLKKGQKVLYVWYWV